MEKNIGLRQKSIKGLDKRLSEVMEYALKKDPKKYKTQSLVAKEIGFSRPNLSSALKGDERYLTENIIDKFIDKFPELNKIWLLKHEGEMLKDNTAGRDIITGGTNITGNFKEDATINIDNSGFNKELSDAQEKNIDLLEQKIQGLENAPIPKKSYEVGKGRPYYNADWTLSFKEINDDTAYNPEFNIDFPPANKEGVQWYRGKGQSMQGEIDSGDYVALQEVEDFSWFPLGRIYGVVTKNGFRTIKKVVQSTENKDNWRLISANPDKDKHPDQEIPKEMVERLFKVLFVIKDLEE